MLEMKDRIVRNAYGRLKRFTQFLILCRSQHGGFDTFGFHVIAFSLGVVQTCHPLDPGHFHQIIIRFLPFRRDGFHSFCVVVKRIGHLVIMLQ